MSKINMCIDKNKESSMLVQPAIQYVVGCCYWSINILFLSNKSCDNLRFWKLGNNTHVAAVCHGHASISTVLCGACVLSDYNHGGKHLLVQHTLYTVLLGRLVS